MSNLQMEVKQYWLLWIARAPMQIIMMIRFSILSQMLNTYRYNLEQLFALLHKTIGMTKDERYAEIHILLYKI